MPEEKKVEIFWFTAVEAMRAFRELTKDPNSYLHRQMHGDSGITEAAIRDLERVIEAARTNPQTG